MTPFKYTFLGLIALLAFGLVASGGNEGGDAERITLARGSDDITKSVLENPSALKTALASPELKQSVIQKLTKDLS